MCSHPVAGRDRDTGLIQSMGALVVQMIAEVLLLWRQRHRIPAPIAELLIGESYDEDPDLYLWGIRVSDDSFEPWDLLIAARNRFENNLPVDRPLTEPDIALHLPGRYLALIEAKFTSPNGWYRPGVRENDKSLTLEELLDIYSSEELRLLDRDRAQQCDRIS